MLIKWAKRLYESIFTLRFLKNFGVGVCMTILNTSILYLFVEKVGSHPVATNVVRSIVMTQVQFCLHYFFTWRDRRDEPWKNQWRRFQVQEVGGSVLSQVTFAVTVGILGAPYLLTYLMCVPLFGLIKFDISNSIVFRRRVTSM